MGSKTLFIAVFIRPEQVAVYCLNSDELLNVFNEMNVNSFGRVVAYLALVYRMNIPEEDVRCEAVRLVVPILKHTNIIGVEKESFIRRIFSGVGHVLYKWSIS